MLAGPEEVQRYLIATLKHCMRVEYYLDRLEVSCDDPERPHDIVGIRNKFDPFVAKRLALDFRPDCNENRRIYFPIIRGGVNSHRRQLHHRIWNMQTEEENYCLSLIDAICSLREPRNYQNGTHSWEEIRRTLRLPIEELKEIAERYLDLMQNKIEEPDTKGVVSFRELSNIGLETRVYERIRERCAEALVVFKEDMGMLPF